MSSLSLPPFDDTTTWGGVPPDDIDEGDIVGVAMRKEKVLREIAALQEDLQALLSRVKTVEGEVDKLTSGNQTLQMYIDNLTRQLTKR